ncbi:MAG: hypothetical protein QM535_02885 [Limnohabitans sp.]|nr:hypothetical protein [Limnohabitans sp.]
MTIFSKTSLQIFSLFALVAATFSLCADGDWGWFSDSSFAPEAYVQDESYRQLFYSTDMFYASEEDWYSSHDEKHSRRFESSIIADWKKYLNNSIPEKELKFYIFSDSAATDVKQITKAILAKDTKSKWSKQVNFANNKNKQFFTFINLARSLETFTNNKASWNYDTDRMDPMNSMSLKQAQSIEKIYQLTKDSFLKSKYWILTMKSYFYSVNRSEAITFFNKTQAAVAKDENYYRGLSYVAGALYKKKMYANSNFMYALVFDNCPTLRTVATYCFHPQNDADFNQALALAKSNAQKGALWSLYGYYADATTAIEKMYALEPTNKHLDYLLTRALNIEENKLNSVSWEDADSKEKKDKKVGVNPKLYSLVIQIAKANNTRTPYLWNIGAGYLEVIKGNNVSASKYFDLAEKNIPSTKLAQQQFKLFKAYNEIAAVKKMDAAAQEKLLPTLKWIYSLSKEGNSAKNLRSNFLSNWSKTYISSLYKKQGDEVYAELFSRDFNFYLNQTRLEKMQAYFEEKHNTQWDILAQSLYDVTLNDIYEFKAIKLAYTDNIKEAIVQMEKSDNKEFVLLGNPFNGNIKDCHDCEHAAFQKTKYSKIAFLKKIEELQNNIAKGGDNYMDNILVANAFYNMTFYGNARMFYENKIINEHGSDYISDTYKGLLQNDKLAEKYYTQALNAAKNDEQKAKAVYLLTKIERNAFYQTPAFKPYEIDYIAFNGFKTLKNKYSHTKYYQDVINECGYFSNFVK